MFLGSAVVWRLPIAWTSWPTSHCYVIAPPRKVASDSPLLVSSPSISRLDDGSLRFNWHHCYWVNPVLRINRTCISYLSSWPLQAKAKVIQFLLQELAAFSVFIHQQKKCILLFKNWGNEMKSAPHFSPTFFSPQHSKMSHNNVSKLAEAILAKIVNAAKQRVLEELFTHSKTHFYTAPC